MKEYIKKMNTKDKINFIKNKKSIALLAPSFPIDFEYPAIIGMLRELGFNKVTELTFGARMVNWNYVQYIKGHLDQELFIASPCPTVVNFIKAQYPDFTQYLMPIASPMLAAARIYKEHHPEYEIIFISPCFAKEKLEAVNHQDNIDMVITFTEIKEMFNLKKIKEQDFNRQYFFDSFIQEFTKVYPISGGLGNTAHIGNLFTKKEILITDGLTNIKLALEQIKNKEKTYRFLDILNCPGGCIGGPATSKELNTEEKEAKIASYISKASEHNLGSHEGKISYAKEINLRVEF